MTTPVMTPRAAREQHAFRELLDAMARPGTIHTAASAEEDGRPAGVTLLEALLDHEVSFAVVPPNAEVEGLVLRLTGSYLAGTRIADYILAEGDGIVAALEEASEGKPEYPDWGATVLAVVNTISAGPGQGARLDLRGPGIQDTRSVWVDGFSADARATFAARNREVPLGVDVVLVARDGTFTCLPRYTVIQEGS